MLKIGTIYQAINNTNQKSYIGKTIQNFNKYKQLHINKALKGIDKLFYRALRKYGPENFKWKILFQDYCHPNKLNELEKFFIAYYETTDRLKGYNITPGGEWGDTLSNHPNKKEIYKRGVETRKRNGNFLTGQDSWLSKNKMTPEDMEKKAKKSGNTQRRRGV